MGRLKQLVPWEGMPLVAWQVEQMRAAAPMRLSSSSATRPTRYDPLCRLTCASPSTTPTKTAARLRFEAGPKPSATTIEAHPHPQRRPARPAWVSRLASTAGARRGRPSFRLDSRDASAIPSLVDGSLLSELREVNEETLGLRAAPSVTPTTRSSSPSPTQRPTSTSTPPTNTPPPSRLTRRWAKTRIPLPRGRTRAGEGWPFRAPPAHRPTTRRPSHLYAASRIYDNLQNV